MTTTNSTQTVGEAMQARTMKHNEATALLARIEAAQNAIEEHQKQLATMNPAVSFYAPVADYHSKQIIKHVDIRNDAVVEYSRVMWSIWKADLPIFTTTGIQEISFTLYEPAKEVKVAIAS